MVRWEGWSGLNVNLGVFEMIATGGVDYVLLAQSLHGRSVGIPRAFTTF
ncbi:MULTISPECIES: hypothetical protein [Microtetraspora]|uniref:Uncharacterized protein n=1 Tax=Microtetraspora glauca TaxID=1996 RepID=A0ABV3GAX1_MICGL|nr:hypothetical protein [Microtetraspora sp. AC03309]MCC5578238.1 hypothetical protein [Microtetraspora sp. AC03309]